MRQGEVEGPPEPRALMALVACPVAEGQSAWHSGFWSLPARDRVVQALLLHLGLERGRLEFCGLLVSSQPAPGRLSWWGAGICPLGLGPVPAARRGWIPEGSGCDAALLPGLALLSFWPVGFGGFTCLLIICFFFILSLVMFLLAGPWGAVTIPHHYQKIPLPAPRAAVLNGDSSSHPFHFLPPPPPPPPHSHLPLFSSFGYHRLPHSTAEELPYGPGSSPLASWVFIWFVFLFWVAFPSPLVCFGACASGGVCPTPPFPFQSGCGMSVA